MAEMTIAFCATHFGAHTAQTFILKFAHGTFIHRRGETGPAAARVIFGFRTEQRGAATRAMIGAAVLIIIQFACKSPLGARLSQHMIALGGKAGPPLCIGEFKLVHSRFVPQAKGGGKQLVKTVKRIVNHEPKQFSKLWPLNDAIVVGTSSIWAKLQGNTIVKISIIKAALCSAVVVATGFGASSAQAATSATANASAKIITAVSVTKSTDLNFGTAVSGAAGGTVVVSNAIAATQTCTGVLCTGGGQTSAQFAVAGATGTTAIITVPATVTLSSGTNSMTAALSSSANSLTLAGTSADAFQVGGSLAVAANQATGSYTGTFTVSVAYQ